MGDPKPGRGRPLILPQVEGEGLDSQVIDELERQGVEHDQPAPIEDPDPDEAERLMLPLLILDF